MTATALTVSSWPADPSVTVRESTIASILRKAAAEVGDVTAYVGGTPNAATRLRRTYSEVLSDVEALARSLTDRFEPGDRIAVLSPSTYEFFVLSFAAAFARLILVPMNPLLRPAEVEHILRRSSARAVFHVAEHRGNDVAGLLEPLTQLPSIEDLVNFERFAELLAAGASSSCELVDPAPDEVAQLVFTSGTTGAAKGVMLTHRGMTNASRIGGDRFGVGAGDVYVNTIPLFHVGGQSLNFQVVQARATNVVVQQYEAGLHLDLLDTERATHTAGVPTMYQAVIEHPDFTKRDLSRLRSISSGGAMVPVEMIRRLEAELKVQTTIIFGQTEACGFISMTFRDDNPDDKSTTIGKMLGHLEGKVVDRESGEIVPIGEVGELLVRGPGVMAGYFDDPEQTAETLDAEGWLRTGDLVTMDGRGYLRIAGRAKEMIVTGGINVYPAEIERVIGEHPAVAEVAVLSLPDKRWGEAVVAVVRLLQGEVAEVDELESYTRERLAPYKVPKRWAFTADMPLTASGKVQKFLLEERLAAGEL